jgi:glutamate racemase
MIQRFWIPVLAALMTLVPLGDSVAGDSVQTRIARLAERDSITVLVTDSGLGGLSVCADIESRARQTGLYRQIRIIFANAIPESNRGYNRMKNTADKIRVFNEALKGLAGWYAPDGILVACNTLSVLIPQTPFVASTAIPVLGIVETGVEMLYKRLVKEPKSTAIIFGTETTIEAGTHRQKLIEKGIDSARLVQQACPNLAGEIEADAQSDLVRTAVDLFVSDALERMSRKDDRVLAGLCCTHYGYVATQFGESLRSQGVADAEIIDPNARMSDVLFPPGKPRRSNTPDIRVEVVSRAVIAPAEITSIGALVDPVSPATAAALRNYTLKRDLFPFDPEEK